MTFNNLSRSQHQSQVNHGSLVVSIDQSLVIDMTEHSYRPPYF